MKLFKKNRNVVVPDELRTAFLNRIIKKLDNDPLVPHPNSAIFESMLNCLVPYTTMLVMPGSGIGWTLRWADDMIEIAIMLGMTDMKVLKVMFNATGYIIVAMDLVKLDHRLVKPCESFGDPIGLKKAIDDFRKTVV